MLNSVGLIGGAAAVVPSALASGPPARLEGQGNRVAADQAVETRQAGRVGAVDRLGATGDGARRIEFALAQSERDARHRLAVEMRERSDLLAGIEQGLEAMQSGLEAIVKRYPPYPADNPERIELLNQANGLKKQIEALALPPERDADTRGAVTREKVVEMAPALAELLGLEPFPVDVITDEELAGILSVVDASKKEAARAQEKIWSDLRAYVESESEAEVTLRGGESADALAETRAAITQARDVLATWV